MRHQRPRDRHALARRAGAADPYREAGCQQRDHLLTRWAAPRKPHFAFEEAVLLPAFGGGRSHSRPAEEALAHDAAGSCAARLA